MLLIGKFSFVCWIIKIRFSYSYDINEINISFHAKVNFQKKVYYCCVRLNCLVLQLFLNVQARKSVSNLFLGIAIFTGDLNDIIRE